MYTELWTMAVIFKHLQLLSDMQSHINEFMLHNKINLLNYHLRVFGFSSVGSEENWSVVPLGSFSTIFSPGLRMRFLEAPQNVLAQLKSRWVDNLTLCQRSISVTCWSLSFWNQCESSPSLALLVPSWLTNAFSLLFLLIKQMIWSLP
mgnify:CR=1 FL=1